MLFGDFTESQPKGFTDLIDEEESTGDYGYLSDSDLEDDEDEVSLNTARNLQDTQRSSSSIPGGGDLACEVQEEHREEGKVVNILDMAFVT